MVDSSFRTLLNKFELECQRRMKEFQCAVHLCLGQHEVPVKINEHLGLEDWVFSTHRSHGHYLAKGGSTEKLMDEILGKESGVNGGYSGSQSFCDVGLRFHSTAIVGGLVASATGVALANKLKGDASRVVCCVGDGATEQGVFWESLNFAALHQLRIVYVCENNFLSVHAHLGARQAMPLREKVEAFGVAYLSEAKRFEEALTSTPSFLEVFCERKCNHVSAMEDLRE